MTGNTACVVVVLCFVPTSTRVRVVVSNFLRWKRHFLCSLSCVREYWRLVSYLRNCAKIQNKLQDDATTANIYDITCRGLCVCVCVCWNLVLYFRSIATQKTLLKYFRTTICDFMGSNFLPIVWTCMQRLLFGHYRRFLVAKSGQTQQDGQDNIKIIGRGYKKNGGRR